MLTEILKLTTNFPFHSVSVIVAIVLVVVGRMWMWFGNICRAFWHWICVCLCICKTLNAKCFQTANIFYDDAISFSPPPPQSLNVSVFVFRFLHLFQSFTFAFASMRSLSNLFRVVIHFNEFHTEQHTAQHAQNKTKIATNLNRNEFDTFFVVVVVFMWMCLYVWELAGGWITINPLQSNQLSAGYESLLESFIPTLI